MTRRLLAVFAEAFQMKSTKAMIKLISLLTFALVLGAVAVGLLSRPKPMQCPRMRTSRQAAR